MKNMIITNKPFITPHDKKYPPFEYFYYSMLFLTVYMPTNEHISRHNFILVGLGMQNVISPLGANLTLRHNGERLKMIVLGVPSYALIL